jgi:DNA-binding transcriptional MerR regulator
MYRIGEAATLLGLKTYVLRFWETEFPQIKPKRTDKGQRLYTEEHIETLKQIQHLLHERGLTIEGARKELEEGAPECEESSGLLREAVAELEEIRTILAAANGVA